MTDLDVLESQLDKDNPNDWEWLSLLAELREARSEHTPDASLPPFEPDATKRRKMLIEIEVSAGFESRLDNQWEVEREINADRWVWRWATEPSVAAVAEHIVAMVEGLSGSSTGKEILRAAYELKAGNG